MKHFTIGLPFTFSWDQVVCAFWKRYNVLQSKRILSEDVVSREIVDNKLVTKRLIKKTDSKAEKAVTKILFFLKKPKFSYVLEESVVDMKGKKFTTYTRNIGRDGELATIVEKCEYTVDPQNSHNTSLEKNVWIESTYRYSTIIETTLYKYMKTFRALKSSHELNTTLERLHMVGKGTLKDKAMMKAGKMLQKNPKVIK